MSAAAFVNGQLAERKAIGRLVAFWTARAAYRAATTPWWNLRQQRRLRWTTACLTQLLDAIEKGDQHNEASKWMGDWPGEKLDRAVIDTIAKYESTPADEGDAA